MSFYGHLFSSQEDHDSYRKCKNKLRVGDKVKVFLRNRDYFARNLEDINNKMLSEPIDVIAELNYYESGKEFLIGSITRSTQLYKIGSNDGMIIKKHRKYEDFKYNYITLDSDVRIAQIIRGTR